MKEDISWIYFLCIEDQLPESYYRLSREFIKNGFSLIPINLEQLSLFYADNEPLNVICLVGNFEAQSKFKKSVFSRLNYYILNKKINLFHISSFLSEKFVKKQNNYNYYQLPMPASVLVYNIKSLCETLSNKKVWPGGKRAKIPV